MSQRAPRFPSDYEVMLRKGPDMFSGRLCNISRGGACLLGSDDFSIGERLMVDYIFGQTRATVMWRMGRMAGLKFDDQLTDTGVQVIRTEKAATTAAEEMRAIAS